MTHKLPIPGRRIREIRQRFGFSLRDMGEKCNMDFSTFGRVERGLGYTEYTLNKIADTLECDVSSFFLPDEIKDFYKLPDDQKKMIGKLVSDLAKNS